MSVVSASIWMFVDVMAGHSYSSPVIPVWNALVRLGFFLITSTLLEALKNRIRREENLSRTDSLTGINNSRAFREWLNHHLSISGRFGQTLTPGYVDLDNFKQVNDNLGHSAGDLVLRAVGSVLSASVRSTDVVGRLGVAVFKRLPRDADEALAMADALMYEVKKGSKNEVRYSEIDAEAQAFHAAGNRTRAARGPAY